MKKLLVAFPLTLIIGFLFGMFINNKLVQRKLSGFIFSPKPILCPMGTAKYNGTNLVLVVKKQGQNLPHPEQVATYEMEDGDVLLHFNRTTLHNLYYERYLLDKGNNPRVPKDKTHGPVLIVSRHRS